MPRHQPVPAPVAWHVARWGTEPWSRGSWSTLLPGASPSIRARLGRPVDDRLVLAGEATHPQRPAMVHGAWEEGERAAAWAVERHRPGDQAVLVVGAGAAGIAAATTVARAGVPVIVLEARNRIGGRIHSVELDGTVVDAGAAWLQQWGHNVVARRAEELRLPTVATDFDDPLSASDALSQEELVAALAAARPVLDAATTAGGTVPLADRLLEALAGPGRSLSASARLAFQYLVDGDIVAESGCEPAAMAAGGATEPGVGDGDRWLPGGLGQLLAHALDAAGGVEVRADWPIESLRRDDRGVVAVGPRGAVLGARCICTVPVGVLPHVRFEPELPAEHRAALAGLTMGVVEKVVLRYPTRWWPSTPSGYLRWYSNPASWVEWLDLSDGLGRPTVAAIIAGDAVHRHHGGRSDADVADAVHRTLQAWAARVRAGQ